MSPRAFLWFCTTIFSITVVLINGQSNQPTLPIRGSTEQTSVSPWMGNNVTEAPSSSAPSRIPLYLAVLVSFGAVDTSGSFVASDLALKHINEREDVLPGYELRMSLSNSAVSFTHTHTHACLYRDTYIYILCIDIVIYMGGHGQRQGVINICNNNT